MQAARQEASPFGSNRQHPQKKASLYVGDLCPDVTEEDLIVKFSSTVPVVSAHLCRCSATGKSLCYGYINFDSRFSASTALACLNHTALMGKSMRIMWFQKDQSQRRSGIGNLFVKNLDISITSGCLERIFSPFGTILSCKVAEEDGKSKGFGYVQFDSEQSAVTARWALHGSIIDGKKLCVTKFIKKTERVDLLGKDDSTNLYVNNLSKDVTEDFLLKTFGPYGRVSSVVVMRDGTGKSRGFGFVSFLKPESARKATEALNGALLGSKKLFVGKAQTKTDRTEMLKHELKEKFISGFTKLKLFNLYVKNLSESVDETRLRVIFGRYGVVVSAKVMRLENGLSKGFGFVCFSNREESEQAKRELNGCLVDGKPLVVRVAERKEDRLKRLQRYFAKQSGSIEDVWFRFPHVPACYPSSYAYTQPFYAGCPAFLPKISSYPKQKGNTQDMMNKRMVLCEITTSPYPSDTGNTGGEGPRCADAEISSKVSTSNSLEDATSVLKAALLKSPHAEESLNQVTEEADTGPVVDTKCSLSLEP